MNFEERAQERAAERSRLQQEKERRNRESVVVAQEIANQIVHYSNAHKIPILGPSIREQGKVVEFTKDGKGKMFITVNSLDSFDVETSKGKKPNLKETPMIDQVLDHLDD